MNQREKEAYLREYSILKAQGKPFFPYAVAKDSLMGLLVVVVIIVLSMLLRRRARPEGHARDDDLRAAPGLVLLLPLPAAARDQAAGLPRRWRRSASRRSAMILLFLLPFYDRSAERRIERRPIAVATLVFVICAMALLTLRGATAGSPTAQTITAPAAVNAAGKAAVSEFYAGRAAASRSRLRAPATRSAPPATTGRARR